MNRTRPNAKSQFTQAALARRSANMAASKVRRQNSIFKSRNISGITAQTIRVGGWANPSSGGELKYKDRGSAQEVLDGTDTWDVINATALMNGVGGGSGADQRVGRKITMKSLMFRYSYFMNPNATTISSGGSPLRIIIFYDKQANATLPTIANLLQSDIYNSNNNLDNRDRFVILADIYTDPISSAGNTGVAGKRYIPLNHEVVFNNGDNADEIGSITTGSIFITFAQNGGIKTNALANGTQFKWNSRIRYEDK